MPWNLSRVFRQTALAYPQTKTPPIPAGFFLANDASGDQIAILSSLVARKATLRLALIWIGLAGRRIAAHAGGALAHLQDAEPGDLHPLALLEVLGDQADQVFEHLLALLLGQLVLLRQRGGKMLAVAAGGRFVY